MSTTLVTISSGSSGARIVVHRTQLAMASVVSGPPGPPGPGGGALSSFEAASPLSGHQVIALDASGKAVYASCDNLAQVLRVVGISTAAAAAAAPISVQSKDTLEHAGWSWVAGDTILLGLNGALTSSLPVGAAFLQVLGKALAPTRILVGVQPPIIL